jgi:large subunit ribosomal protein L15
MLNLSTLRAAPGARANKKRVGRGLGSKGTTAGRGQKGQSSRSGVGGLKRLGMRKEMLAMPKLRGFNSMHAKAQVVNIAKIEALFVAGETVSPITLAKKKLVRSSAEAVKILGAGELSKAVTVKNCAISASAKAAVEKAGGKIE